MPSSASPSKLTHLDAAGRVHMVDVTAKPVTARTATATGSVRMSGTARALLAAGDLDKGDALAVARIAGIAAAKRTPDLVPLCHPVAIGSVDVSVEPSGDGVAITARVATADRTGIEMEALTCVAVAALTVVDMVKAVDRDATIGPSRVVAKTGGRSGDWSLDADGRLVAAPLPAASSLEAPPDPGGRAMPASLAGRRALVVTVSDRRAAGTALDTAGPSIAERLRLLGAAADLVVVPDGVDPVRRAVRRAVHDGVDLVVTTGGTGVGPRDLTPEALEPIVGRRLPGVEHAVRAAGTTPFAALSRTVVGVAGESTVVVALPGSRRAVGEGLDALDPLWHHLLDQGDGGDHPEALGSGPVRGSER